MGVKPCLSGRDGFPPACMRAPTTDTCPLAAAKCRGVRPLVSLNEREGGERRRGREGKGDGRREKKGRREGRREDREKVEEKGDRFNERMLARAALDQPYQVCTRCQCLSQRHNTRRLFHSHVQHSLGSGVGVVLDQHVHTVITATGGL